MNNGVFSSYRLMHTDQQLQCTLHIYLEGKKEVAVTLGSNVCSIKRIILDQFQKGLNQYWIPTSYTYVENFSSGSLRDF